MSNLPLPVRFSFEDAKAASAAWGANCGPGAIAAFAGLTLDELRPHLGDFESKCYTNPTLMWATLVSLGVGFSVNTLSPKWPAFGLARIQWEGPWTEPGVPIKARYRMTHWVAVASDTDGKTLIYDMNAMREGCDGWIRLHLWESDLVPWLLRECCPRANGKWHITHAVHIFKREVHGG